MSKITIVTAFFNINRGNFNNPQLARSVKTYFEYFAFWARMKNKIIVYTQPEFTEKILAIREKYGLKDRTTIVEIEEVFELFPQLYKRMEDVAENEEFKNFRYYKNALSNQAKYDYIMLMKYWCMHDAVSKKLTENIVAWMDFGFNHGGKFFGNPLEFDYEWIWEEKESKLEKIQLFSLKEIADVAAIVSLQLQCDIIMGPIILAPAELCEDFWRVMLNAMEALLMLDCIDDDQQLLLMATRKSPELFEVHTSTWFMPLKEMGGEHLSVKQLVAENIECRDNVNIKTKLKKYLRGLIFRKQEIRSDIKCEFIERISNTVEKYY